MKYALCAALALLATAQTPAISAEPRQWNVGLAATADQSPFVGGDTQIGVKPVIIKENGFDIAGPAWSFSATAEREFYIGAGLDEWDADRGDSPALQDMTELDRAINLRVGGAWKLATGTVSTDFAQDVAAHEGAQAKLRYTYHPDTPLNLRPYAELQWLSADLTDYYVGVDAAEAKAGRPVYQADDSLALKVGVKMEKPLNDRLTLVGGVSATGYGSAIADSPIIDSSTVWGGYAGAAYRW
jgi:outer membrane protein